MTILNNNKDIIKREIVNNSLIKNNKDTPNKTNSNIIKINFDDKDNFINLSNLERETIINK